MFKIPEDDNVIDEESKEDKELEEEIDENDNKDLEEELESDDDI